MAAYYGNTHIRALADVDSRSGIRGVEVLVALREEFVGVVDLQVVAFAQDGIVREPGTEDLLRVSMEMGADVVGSDFPLMQHNSADQLHIEVPHLQNPYRGLPHRSKGLGQQFFQGLAIGVPLLELGSDSLQLGIAFFLHAPLERIYFIYKRLKFL